MTITGLIPLDVIHRGLVKIGNETGNLAFDYAQEDAFS